jgi:SAM-dependent methyltransferase
MDILELQKFYNSTLGSFCEKALTLALSPLFVRATQESPTRAKDTRLIGLGYPTPYLNRFGIDFYTSIAFMPANQGVMCWPPQDSSLNASALITPDALPLMDASIDIILLSHCLEFADYPQQFLEELWRVLTPGGQIILIVPNRRGIWSFWENTPFGHGQPYSKGQLSRLLENHGFEVMQSGDALYAPPSSKKLFVKFRALAERIGRRIWPRFSGVLLIRARKKAYRGVLAKSKQTKRGFAPILVPHQGTATQGTATREKG